MTPAKPDPIKHCASCNKLMTRKRYNGTLEANNIFRRRKYCDQICMAKGLMRDDIKWFSGHPRARKFRKEFCEFCGSKRNLLVHHMDKDPLNNKLENLKTLCPSCHVKWHKNQKRLMGAQMIITANCGHYIDDNCRCTYGAFYGKPDYESIERAAIIGFAALWASDLDGEMIPCPEEEFHIGQQLYTEANALGFK